MPAIDNIKWSDCNTTPRSFVDRNTTPLPPDKLS
jgi:hypothetical protein